MILMIVILIPLAGGFLAWLTGRRNPLLPRIISLAALALDLLLFVIAILPGQEYPASENWLMQFQKDWIPFFGISFSLALDGLSLLMLLLTLLLGLLAVIVSWKEIQHRTGFYYFNLLWAVSGIIGVFLAIDMFLFYFFWELMIIPMYFLISIWGDANRGRAASKFFIYTQASGLLMFISIIVLYFLQGQQTGEYTFDYREMLFTSIPPGLSMLLMFGFLAAFFVKLAVVPLHTWQPDAYSSAPTGVTLILAGIMLKTGAYGLIRFAVPLFPDAATVFAPVGMLLGVIGILYGAKLAFAQTDLKRLIAYTSISHMGFVLVGVYAFNLIALQGVVVQMIAHAISTGALFIMAGQLQQRLQTRDIGRMGGLWSQAPVMGAMGLIFALASLGLPGMGNFVAEFLILTGAFKANVMMTGLACLGLIAATIYSLRIVQKIFLGHEKPDISIKDLNVKEKLIFGLLVVLILYLGLMPGKIMRIAEPALTNSMIVQQDIPDGNMDRTDVKLSNYAFYDRD